MGQKTPIFTPQKGGFAVINTLEWGSQKGPKIPLFWPYFDPFLAHFWPHFWRPFNVRSVEKGPKKGVQKWVIFGVQKWVIFGVPLGSGVWTPDPGVRKWSTPKMSRPLFLETGQKLIGQKSSGGKMIASKIRLP